MNIIVKTSSGHITVRPDTTWEKDNEDFYPPEFVDELTYSPVLFARILKPGRSVGRKFASRYYDSIGFGVLLYPENMLDGTPEGYAQAICLDHTSFLPSPMFPPERLEKKGHFRLFRNEHDLFVFDLDHGAGHRGVKTEVGDIERITVPDLHHIDRFLGGGDQRVHIEKFIRAAVIFDKIIPAAAGIAGHTGVFVPDQPMENLVGRAVSPAGIKTEDRIRFFFATGADID